MAEGSYCIILGYLADLLSSYSLHRFEENHLPLGQGLSRLAILSALLVPCSKEPKSCLSIYMDLDFHTFEVPQLISKHHLVLLKDTVKFLCVYS